MKKLTKTDIELLSYTSKYVTYLKGRKCRGEKKSREQNVAQILMKNRDFFFLRLLNF